MMLKFFIHEIELDEKTVYQQQAAILTLVTYGLLYVFKLLTTPSRD